MFCVKIAQKYFKEKQNISKVNTFSQNVLWNQKNFFKNNFNWMLTKLD
jgi:hypothetical protein